MFNWRVSVVCLGNLLVLVLLFGCLLCLVVYLVFVVCGSWAVLLVSAAVVFGLGGLLVWLGCYCCSLFKLFWCFRFWWVCIVGWFDYVSGWVWGGLFWMV